MRLRRRANSLAPISTPPKQRMRPRLHGQEERRCGFSTTASKTSRGATIYRSSISSHCMAYGLGFRRRRGRRSEEHTSELQSLMRISYAVFCLKKKKIKKTKNTQAKMREYNHDH